MRVSSVGWACIDLESVLQEAQRSAEVTHSHPEGIKGAQATASAVYLARTGSAKHHIRDYIEATFHYDLRASLDEIRPSYRFDVSCQGSVPQAIIAFLESENYEDAVRKAISLGGDSDTQACIAGAIAEAFYDGVSDDIARRVWDEFLDDRLREVIRQFWITYPYQYRT
jgi:ADP-ribosylglycohydrolase